MSRRVKTTTAKAGATASERRVLSAVSAAGAEPSQSTDGYVIQQNEYLHLLFELGGTDPVFRIRIWFYSEISGHWHRSRQVVVNDDDIVTVEVQGLDRVYLQVETTPSGTSPTLSAWVALARNV